MGFRMLGSFSIGRWFGFRIRIDYSWFVVFALVLWTFSAYEFPSRLPGQARVAYYLMGGAAAVLFFLSVLLHELSHSAVARARGIPVEGITLFIFGGVAQMRMEARRPADEFLLTAVGPLSSFLLAGLFFTLDVAVDFLAWPRPIGAVAAFLALLNLVLAVFNLIPAFPLDGGRLFRSAMWRLTGNLDTSTRWATLLGRGFGYLLLLTGFLAALQGLLLPGLWAGLLGWFIANAAGASYRQFVVRRALAGVRVEQVMFPDPLAVRADLTAAELADRYFLRWPFSAYPVVQDDRLVGLVSLDAVAELSPQARSSALVSELMRPAEEIQIVSPEETLDDVLARLEPADEGRVLVARDGELVGVLTLRDIGRWVERARRLGRVGEWGGGGAGALGVGGGPQGVGRYRTEPGDSESRQTGAGWEGGPDG
ncbi:MAG: site-2 protease family protein [Gemmatimonadota bacterium]